MNQYGLTESTYYVGYSLFDAYVAEPKGESMLDSISKLFDYDHEKVKFKFSFLIDNLKSIK